MMEDREFFTVLDEQRAALPESTRKTLEALQQLATTPKLPSSNTIIMQPPPQLPINQTPPPVGLGWGP